MNAAFRLATPINNTWYCIMHKCISATRHLLRLLTRYIIESVTPTVYSIKKSTDRELASETHCAISDPCDPD